MLRLIVLNTASLFAEGRFDAYCERMSTYRKQKINAMRFQKDKNLSLGAGIALDYCLHDCGLAEQEMQYDTTQNQKPVFRNRPDLHFNLSHSGEWVAVAFSDAPVGCDIEQIKPVSLQIARRFFCRAEYEAIQNAETIEAQTELFFRYWTLKESFLKATGLGFSLPLNRFCITLSESITVDCDAVDAQYVFAEYADIPTCRLALCASSMAQKPSAENITQLL